MKLKNKELIIIGIIILIGFFYYLRTINEGFQDIPESSIQEQQTYGLPTNPEISVKQRSTDINDLLGQHLTAKKSTRFPTLQEQNASKMDAQQQRGASIASLIGKKGSPVKSLPKSYDNTNSQNLQGSITLHGVQGPEGPQGPQGLQGIQGPQGDKGPPGPTTQVRDFSNDINMINNDIIAIKEQIGLMNKNGPQRLSENASNKIEELGKLITSRGLEGVISKAQEQAPYLNSYFDKVDKNNQEIMNSYLDSIINFINNDENITPTEVIMFLRGWLTSYGANITEPEPENIEKFTNCKKVSYRDYTTKFSLIPLEYAPAL